MRAATHCETSRFSQLYTPTRGRLKAPGFLLPPQLLRLYFEQTQHRLPTLSASLAKGFVSEAELLLKSPSAQYTVSKQDLRFKQNLLRYGNRDPSTRPAVFLRHRTRSLPSSNVHHPPHIRTPRTPTVTLFRPGIQSAARCPVSAEMKPPKERATRECGLVTTRLTNAD